MLFWTSVKDSRDPAEIQAYLDQFPQGTFAGQNATGGAIIVRSGDKLYIIEGKPPIPAPQAMKDFQDNWAVSFAKDFQDNWNVSFMKDFQDRWNVSFMNDKANESYKQAMKDFQDNWNVSFMKNFQDN